MQFLDVASIRRWTDGDYSVTTDPAAVDGDAVYRFLVEESYWWGERPREAIDHAISESRCYTMRHETSGEFAGFARVVTDGTWFAWIGDVMVVPEHRGGRGKFLVRCVMEDLASVRRVVLGTRDAHGLYAQFGFTPVPDPASWMERWFEAAGRSDLSGPSGPSERS